MSDDAGAALLAAFIGDDRAAGYPDDPALVLAVEGEVTKDAVVEALQREIASMAAHPYGASPEAAEVRLLLQQCAAGLLDQLDVRERLLSSEGKAPPVQAPSSTPPPSAARSESPASMRADAPPVRPSPQPPSGQPPVRALERTAPPLPAPPVSSSPARPPPPIVPTGLERDAARILAASPSVEAALRSLTALAIARGLPASTAQQAIENLTLATRSSMPTAAGAPPTRVDAGAGPAAEVSPRANVSASAGASEYPGVGAAPRRASEYPGVRAAAGPGQSPGSARRHDPHPLVPADPAQDLLRKALFIGGGLAALGLLAVVGVVIMLTRGNAGAGGAPGAGPGAPPVATGAGVITTGTPTPPVPTGAPVTGATDPTWTSTGRIQAPSAVAPAQPTGTPVTAEAVVASLRRAANIRSTDPRAASEAFREGVAGASGWWVRHEASARVAIAESVVDYIYRLNDAPNEALDAVGLLAPPSSIQQPLRAGDGWRAAWSAGVLLRLARERELPGPVVVRVQSLLTDALGPERPAGGQGVNDGILLALRSQPARLLAMYAPESNPPPDADDALARGLSLWAQAVEAAHRGLPGEAGAPDAATSDVMEGWTTLLTHEPSSTRSRAVHRAIESVIALQRWDAQGPARARFLSWFDSPAVTTSTLSLVTQTLVQRSAAEGIDLTMVLSPGAGDQQRSDLRAAYAQAWDLERVTPAEWIQESVRSVITLALESAQAPSAGPLDDLRRTVQLARGTQAAAARGAFNAEALKALVENINVQARGQAALDPLRNWDWSTRGQAPFMLAYLTTDKAVTARLERINALDNGMQLTVADAEFLGELCFTANPPDVRAAAQKMAARLQDQWSVVYGVLQALPRMARTENNMRFIGVMTGRQVSAASSGRWMIDARRALLERLIEAVAGADQSMTADKLAAELAECYASMSGQKVDAQQIAPEDAGAAALQAMQRLYTAWRAEAAGHVPNTGAPVRLDQLDRRRAGRLAAAVGPIQQFAGEQASAAEALAYIVSGEQPARAAEVSEIISVMQRERRAASHVFEQTKCTQRAILRLWAIRIDRGRTASR